MKTVCSSKALGALAQRQAPNILKIVGALALVLALAASAGTQRNYPPKPELNAQWWQWVLKIPLDQNPQLDQTGAFGALGQSGPVWFLADTPAPMAERTVTVPEGKPLYFPIVNACCGGALHSQGYPPNPLEFARAWCKANIDTVSDMFCEVDAISIPITDKDRVQSIPFAVRVPESNLFGVPGAGTAAPTVDDGYYLLLEPLAPGEHTIHYGARNGDWSYQVIYHITVQ